MFTLHLYKNALTRADDKFHILTHIGARTIGDSESAKLILNLLIAVMIH